MSTPTDRQQVSEALRTCQTWVKSFATPNSIILTRVGSYGDDTLVVEYGATGRIKAAYRIQRGTHTSFSRDKRDAVLATLAGMDS